MSASLLSHRCRQKTGAHFSARCSAYRSTPLTFPPCSARLCKLTNSFISVTYWITLRNGNFGPEAGSASVSFLKNFRSGSGPPVGQNPFAPSRLNLQPRLETGQSSSASGKCRSRTLRTSGSPRQPLRRDRPRRCPTRHVTHPCSGVDNNGFLFCPKIDYITSKGGA